AIKLLQLSNLELGAFVDDELERNPLLERAEGDPGAPAERSDDAGREGAATRHDGDMASLLDSTTGRDGGEAPLDIAEADLYGDSDTAEPKGGGVEYQGAGPWGAGSSGAGSLGAGPWDGGGYHDDGVERTAAGAVTLRDHLLAQVAVDLADPRDRLIGAHLTDLLDDAGYLRADLAAVALALGCTAERVAAVVQRLQRLDPPGVFARDLKECLKLQLAERNRLDPAMATLVDNLDLVARRDDAQLMRRCGVGADDLADMLAEMRTLNPKPGEVFDVDLPPTVVPDVFVRQAADGWHIELNGDTLPKLLVNQRYHVEISATALSRAERDYLADRLSSASWLVKSLDQRARTILRVAREIVRQQDGFLVHGVQHLRPLVLRDIAEAVGMHESTISRVTTNKYMATPRGIFELKYFFTTAIAATTGDHTVSSEAVRHRIRRLIDGEPAGAVLSDDRLVEVLRAEGIDIARRTVAKYRESLRIPSSVQRRRDKRLVTAG
ncbi:MAG: RNA polymerase factor sigma-54, partial [Alphaproteobacteria bacterium]